MSKISRRKLITAGLAGTAGVTGIAVTAGVASQNGLIPPDHGGIYGVGHTLTYAAQRLLVGNSNAREFVQSASEKQREVCNISELWVSTKCGESDTTSGCGANPTVGDAFDNAMCESFFATLQCELLERRRFASQAEAKMAGFSFIEGCYNPVRLHAALAYRSPMAFEAAREAAIAEPT